LAGRVREPLESAERGALLETYVLHELRAWMNLASTGGQLAYWRNAPRSEGDFVWTPARRAVAIGGEAASRWRPEFGRALKGLVEAGVAQKGFGVYLGRETLKDGPIVVRPLRAFLEKLSAGEVFG